MFVTEFIIRKVKNDDPWKDSGIVQEKEWLEELGRESWTVDGRNPHLRGEGASGGGEQNQQRDKNQRR